MILITWSLGGLDAILTDKAPLAVQLGTLIFTGYMFKFSFALIDTLPFYWLTARLSRYLEIDPRADHAD